MQTSSPRLEFVGGILGVVKLCLNARFHQEVLDFFLTVVE